MLLLPRFQWFDGCRRGDCLALAVHVLLSGGAEFTPEHEAVDRAWIQLMAARAPHVVLLPAAVSDHLVSVMRTAKRYFNRFGVQLEAARAHGTGESSADSATLRPLNDALEGAHALYLTDGNPIAALTALRAGKTAALVYRACASGVTVIACGASAMALCEMIWNGEGWEPGLGLIRGLAVLPHHERIAARFSADRLRQGLPDSLTIVGIEDATGVLLEWPDNGTNALVEGAQTRVIGADSVTRYQADGGQVYTDGQTFQLPDVRLSQPTP